VGEQLLLLLHDVVVYTLEPVDAGVDRRLRSITDRWWRCAVVLSAGLTSGRLGPVVYAHA
jgi:hypothetical protein